MDRIFPIDEESFTSEGIPPWRLWRERQKSEDSKCDGLSVWATHQPWEISECETHGHIPTHLTKSKGFLK